jgi:lipoate-protein ligase A
VRVYSPPEPAVVIGRGGKQQLELDRAAIAADGATLYKRPGGGCAVVLDAGNLVVSVALGLPGISHIKTTFAAVGDWVIAGLAACGVPGVEQRGVSDLAIGERKVGGSCVYRTRGLFYYSTTLLVDPDLDLVERYLPHPPREPDYRAGRDHRAFMGSLAGMGLVEDTSTFRNRLGAELNWRLPGLAAATALPDPGSPAQS